VAPTVSSGPPVVEPQAPLPVEPQAPLPVEPQAPLPVEPKGPPSATGPPEPEPPVHGDPAVAALASQLAALLAGRLPEDSSVSALFQTRLDDSDAVAAGLTRLADERSQLQAATQRIDAQLAQVGQLLPKPEPPAVLSQELVQPTPPTEPTCTLPEPDALPPFLNAPGAAPEAPAALTLPEPAPPTPPKPLTRAQRRSRRARAQHRAATRRYKEAQREHEGATQRYKEAQAAHEKAQAAYAVALAQHQARAGAYAEELRVHERAVMEWIAQEQACTAAHEKHMRALAAHAEALNTWRAQVAEAARAGLDHQRALSAWQERVREFRRQMREDALRTRQRLDVATRRRRYLEALSAALGSMPDPARGALRTLPRPRTALGQRQTELGELEAALERYRRRLRRLARRCGAGSLVGFLVDRQELLQQLEQARDSVRDRRERLRFVGDEIGHLAAHQEREGRALRRKVLAALVAPNRDERMDALFLQRLSEVRRLRQLTTHGPLPDVETVDAARARKAIERLLPRPDVIGTVAAGQQAQAECTEAIERVDALLDGLQALRNHWQLAFEREAVTLLEALATERTRREAFSLSAEMLQDLKAEGQDALRSLSVWAKRRWGELRALPSRIGESAVWQGLLKLLLIPFLIGLLVFLRGLWSDAVHRIVRWLARLRWLRGRAGALVRGANLAEGPLPALAAWGAGELVLGLLGHDSPEVFVAAVVFRRVIVYLVGRGLLLGLTRRASARRPAVIDAAPDTVALLERTYARCGVVLVVASVASTLARTWMGAGVLHALINALTWIWLVGVWGVWAAAVWRVRLARAWLGLAPPRLGLGDRLALLTEKHRTATPLVPLLLLALAVTALRRWGMRALSEGGILGYVRAVRLGRLARKAAERAPGAQVQLPEAYLREFPMYPLVQDDAALVLPREGELKVALAAIEAWRTNAEDSALLLLGDKGVGKTTLLALVERELTELPARHLTLAHRATDEASLVEQLGPALGCPECPSVEALAAHLNTLPRQVVLLDEAHNVFLRSVGGYDAFDLLVRLVQLTNERIFWVLVFNRYSWVFLKRTQHSSHYFRRQLQLEPWSAPELRELIVRRNERAGLQVEFEEMLLQTGGQGDGPEVVESAEGYFRLLQQASEGNPRIATALWLDSLTPIGDDVLRVGLFRAVDQDHLERLDAELVFALAALVHHENLSVPELQQALNLRVEHAEFYLRLLAQQGLVETKHTDPTRHTLAARTYLQVLALLRGQHLMFE